MALHPHGRRTELELARESNVRRVIGLVGSYGLSGSDKVGLAHEFRRHAATALDEHATAAVEDRQQSRAVANVWREGMWASWPRSRSASPRSPSTSPGQ